MGIGDGWASEPGVETRGRRLVLHPMRTLPRAPVCPNTSAGVVSPFRSLLMVVGVVSIPGRKAAERQESAYE
jgi:hypothetical protein